jgi:hypothetical protein
MSQDERERQLANRRAAWAKIPHDDPRKMKHRAHNRAYNRRAIRRNAEQLTDQAVANYYLGMRVGECPKELIELKREVIRLYRRLKHHPNKNKSA